MDRCSIEATKMEDGTLLGEAYVGVREKVYHVRYENGNPDGFEEAKSMAKSSLEHIFDMSGSLPERIIIEIG